LIDLHRRLSALPSRSHDRRMIMRETASLYGLSEQTLYRALAERATAQGIAPFRSRYTAGAAARQDAVLLRSHRRARGDL
jgi:hypothetical protein